MSLNDRFDLGLLLGCLGSGGAGATVAPLFRLGRPGALCSGLLGSAAS